MQSCTSSIWFAPLHPETILSERTLTTRTPWRTVPHDEITTSILLLDSDSRLRFPKSEILASFDEVPTVPSAESEDPLLPLLPPLAPSLPLPRHRPLLPLLPPRLPTARLLLPLPPPHPRLLLLLTLPLLLLLQLLPLRPLLLLLRLLLQRPPLLPLAMVAGRMLVTSTVSHGPTVTGPPRDSRTLSETTLAPRGRGTTLGLLTPLYVFVLLFETE